MHPLIEDGLLCKSARGPIKYMNPRLICQMVPCVALRSSEDSYEIVETIAVDIPDICGHTVYDLVTGGRYLVLEGNGLVRVCGGTIWPPEPDLQFNGVGHVRIVIALAPRA